MGVLPNKTPIAKYPWVLKPADSNTPGDMLLDHITALLTKEEKWRAAMGSAGATEVDRWLAAAKSTTDSALIHGLEMIYVLMNLGYLKSAVPGNAVREPYGGEILHSDGTLREDMASHEFVTR